MYKKVIWPLILVVSLTLSIVFISGFIVSVYVSSGEEEAQTTEPIDSSQDVPPEGIPIDGSADILILGDSVGFGVGDEENLGIGERYLALIEDEEKKLANISVPGYESNELVSLVTSGENSAIISSADLIIISIGGNDLNRLEFGDNLTLTRVFQEALANYKENLELIIKEIRTVNADAQLAFIGLYDPSDQVESERTRLILEWNYETRLTLATDVKSAYIPTYELFKYHLTDYLSLDEFHPNGSGYQIIAEELARIVN